MSAVTRAAKRRHKIGKRPSHLRSSEPPKTTRPFSVRAQRIIGLLDLGWSASAIAKHLGEAKSRVRVVRLRAERRGIITRPAEFAP